MSTCKYKKYSHYESHYYVQCQPTCRHSRDTAPCGHLRGAGCVCNEGYYLNSQLNCVRIDQCEKQCQVELEDGESFVMEVSYVIHICHEGQPCHVICQGGQLCHLSWRLVMSFIFVMKLSHVMSFVKEVSYVICHGSQ